MTEQSIYRSPDIRRQTFAEAEAFITAKRVRRMVLVQNYQEKTTARLAKLKGAELAAFEKRKVAVDKALANIVDAIDAAERKLALLLTTHNALTVIESNENQL